MDFFGTSDIKERASIDIDFCRLLMLIYLYDNDVLFRSQPTDRSNLSIKNS